MENVIHIPRDVISVGSVICASDMSREDYIAECYNTGTVSVFFERTGSSQTNIPISESLLEEIIFPDIDNNELLGSAVLTCNIPRLDLPVVISVLKRPNEKMNIRHGQKKISSILEGSYANLVVDGAEGDIHLTSYADDSTGGIYLRASNRNRSAEITLETDAINVSANTILSLDSYSEIVLRTLNSESSGESLLSMTNSGELSIVNKSLYFNSDEALVEIPKINITSLDVQLDNANTIINSIDVILNNTNTVVESEGTIQLNAKNLIQLGEKNLEPAIKGDAIVEKIGNIIDEINKMTVLTAFGPAPVSPQNIANFTRIKNELKTSLSKLIKIE